MTIMVDMRCPACNNPVRGTKEVVYINQRRVESVSKCKHCGTKLQFCPHTMDAPAYFGRPK